MPSAKQVCLDDLKFSHDQTLSLLKDFPKDKWTFQRSPADNHALWVLGHHVTSYSWWRSMIDGKQTELPDTYQKLFGMGSTPVGDASKYPSAETLLAQYNKGFAALVSAIEMTPEMDLLAPPATDSGGFCSTRLAAINRATWHEGWHAGQISTIRRSLGMKGVFGS